MRRKQSSTRRRRISKPRKPKTYADVAKLQGTEYHLDEATSVVFYTEDIVVDAMICVGNLLGKFYRINEEQNPLVFTLLEDKSQAIPEKVWHVVWRGNFFMDIEQGPELGGPHRCRLWFKSFTTKQNHWLATLQVMGFFFNEAEMRGYVLHSVAAQDFYMLPDNRDKSIIP